MAESEASNWADRMADEVLKRKKKEYVCEGMWTPSGFFHIGNARTEIFTPYAVHHAFESRGIKSRQNFIIDDFDEIKKIPPGLDVKESEHDKYFGFPCATAPSPLKGYKTWADAFVSQVRDYIGEFGVKVNIISAYKTYKDGKFNDLIIHSLNNSRKIVETWNKIAGTEKSLEFLPIKIICPDCAKLRPTEAVAWDGKKVTYKCGCGSQGSISPLNGNAKLHWRVHWAAHWVYHEVDFESGGKDHFSKGSSVDVSSAICREVFNSPPPEGTPTEFIQVGGAKMAGSVGNVVNLKQWLEVASPELFRFLNFNYRPNKAINFSFSDNSFILLNERHERAEKIYFGLEKAQSEKLTQKITRDYELSHIGKMPKHAPPLLSYSFAAFLVQLMNPEKEFDQILEVIFKSGHIPKSKLSAEEKNNIKQKLIMAKNWILKYAPDDAKFQFANEAPAEVISKISAEQKSALGELASALKTAGTVDEIQEAVFNAVRNHGVKPADFFGLLYMLFLGKSKGPKFGSLVLAIGREKAIERISTARN